MRCNYIESIKYIKNKSWISLYKSHGADMLHDYIFANLWYAMKLIKRNDILPIGCTRTFQYGTTCSEANKSARPNKKTQHNSIICSEVFSAKKKRIKYSKQAIALCLLIYLRHLNLMAMNYFLLSNAQQILTLRRGREKRVHRYIYKFIKQLHPLLFDSCCVFFSRPCVCHHSAAGSPH